MTTGRLAALAALCAWGAAAQQLFDSSPGRALRFHPSDEAVLSGSDDRRDLDCRVEPQQPRLGFDLSFTAGYVVRVPAESVSPDGDSLRVLFRVRPASGGEPVHFRQVFQIAPHSAAGGGTATFPARFSVGPGRYRVDWLMRNQKGTVCSAHWEARAPKPGRTGRLAAAAPPGRVAPHDADVFAAEPPVARRDPEGGGLHVSVLLNLAPLDRERFKLNDYEVGSIVGMLRSLHREPAIGRFSLTAFSAVDRALAFASANQPRLDFAALGEAIGAMQAGVVEADALADPDGESRFLADLLREALEPVPDPPDAIVVLGQKIDREGRVPEEAMDFPVRPARLVQLAFAPNPRSFPWPGAIEAALGPLGLAVYDVTTPQDFSRALEHLLAGLGPDAPGENPPPEPAARRRPAARPSP